MIPKVQSVLSYLGILWLIAFFVGKDQRNDRSGYHLEQGLGLFVTAAVFNLCAGILLFIVPSITFVISIFGLFDYIDGVGYYSSRQRGKKAFAGHL